MLRKYGENLKHLNTLTFVDVTPKNQLSVTQFVFSFTVNIVL